MSDDIYHYRDPFAKIAYCGCICASADKVIVVWSAAVVGDLYRDYESNGEVCPDCVSARALRVLSDQIL
jgi:hypothetical protein